MSSKNCTIGNDAGDCTPELRQKINEWLNWDQVSTHYVRIANFATMNFVSTKSIWRKLIKCALLSPYRMRSRERKSTDLLGNITTWNWKNCFCSDLHLVRPVCVGKCGPATIRWTIWLWYNQPKAWPNTFWSVFQMPKIEHVESSLVSTDDTIVKGMRISDRKNNLKVFLHEICITNGRTWCMSIWSTTLQSFDSINVYHFHAI